MKPTEFWSNTIGLHITPSAPHPQPWAYMVPHRTNNGVKPLRLGAIDAFYFGSNHGSFILGRIEHPNTASLRIIGTEDVSARKYLAHYLIDKAKTPFIVGVIGNASPESSFSISHTLNRVTFCEASKSFTLDLDKVRLAYKILEKFNWKKDVVPLIYALETYRTESDKMSSKFAKAKSDLSKSSAELLAAVNQSSIKPYSGEYTILSWANIEDKK